ncbi:MAG: type III-B CRISPR module RAMP protein Cmr4 [Candidatus Korarchaeum sp.]|nr:type III-B CRISPR module RAMP protein Cmr4 [Candidatus Korarchaeum sp.]
MSGCVLGEVFERGIPFVIRAVTPLHPGSGSRLSGLVDLPVQREAGTDIPVIYGSSLKGALRSWAMMKGIKDVEGIFGPQPGEGDKGMGKAVFMDAKLLFLPVRSMRGVYGWITSRFLLERFERDMRLIAELTKSEGQIRFSLSDLSPSEGEAIGASKNTIKIDSGEGKEEVVLEDHVLSFKSNDMTFLDAFGELKDELIKRLVVVHDDTFKRLVTRAMEVVPHIEVDRERGTVNNLWFQENLPAETMLYSAVFLPASLEGSMRSLLKGFIHVGGDVTTGLGFARVYLL